MDTIETRHQSYLATVAAVAFVAAVYAANPQQTPTPEITDDESKEVSEIVAHAVVPAHPMLKNAPKDQSNPEASKPSRDKEEPRLKQVQLL